MRRVFPITVLLAPQNRIAKPEFMAGGSAEALQQAKAATDRQAGGDGGPAYGHIMFTDPILGENVR